MLTKLLDLQYRYSLSTSQVSSVIDGKEKCWVTLNRKLILLASENNTAKEKFKKLLSYSYTTTQQFWLHPLSMLFRWELFQFPLLGKRGEYFSVWCGLQGRGHWWWGGGLWWTWSSISFVSSGCLNYCRDATRCCYTTRRHLRTVRCSILHK